MQLSIAIVGAIFAIFLIIILHELGHFVMARCCGVRVLKFSLGFGKVLWSHVSKRSGTEYALSVLPLGGYVKMLGEGEEASLPEEAHFAYNCKPLWQRMLIVLAGPLVNFLLAIFAFYCAYLFGTTHYKPVVGEVVPSSIVGQAGLRAGDEILAVDGEKTQNWQQVLMAVVQNAGERGQMSLLIKPQNSLQTKTVTLNLVNWQLDDRSPEFLESLGLQPYQIKVPPIIAVVQPNSPASLAGLQPGDLVLRINGKKIDDWQMLTSWVQEHPNTTMNLLVQREQLRKNLQLSVAAKTENDKLQGYIGVTVQEPVVPESLVSHEHFNLLSAWVPAVEQTWALLKLNFLVTVKLVSGKVSLKSMGGPVTIFRYAGQATQQGLQVYLGFVAFISLAIGYLNLMPIPGLDGGHLLFQLVEAVIRRPVPERIQALGFSLGMVLLVFLMVQATINDLMRLF